MLVATPRVAPAAAVDRAYLVHHEVAQCLLSMALGNSGPSAAEPTTASSGVQTGIIRPAAVLVDPQSALKAVRRACFTEEVSKGVQHQGRRSARAGFTHSLGIVCLLVWVAAQRVDQEYEGGELRRADYRDQSG
jgi:hypothetical protein